MFRPRGRETLLINDAHILFRNFAGKEGKYNREGDRNFCVLLEDPEVTQQLVTDGWNVKYLRAREEDDVDQPYLQISVSYRKIPPSIAMISSRGKTILEESMIELLDLVEIEAADVNINPYEWAVNGSTGKKAYLKTLYLTIREDPLDLRYAHIPEIGSGRMNDLLAIEAPVPVSRQYDFEGEVVDIPQRELGR